MKWKMTEPGTRTTRKQFAIFPVKLFYKDYWSSSPSFTGETVWFEWYFVTEEYQSGEKFDHWYVVKVWQ